MSVDLTYPPPNPSPEISLRISQVAPKFLKNTSRSLLWPLSLLSRDETPETWIAYENLFMQCLRTGDDASARQILDRLVKRYGQTNDRVQAYQGMWEEAMAQDERDTTRVFEFYGRTLETDPTNLPVQKRRIALLKSIGNYNEAITQLTGLLSASPVDAESWAELSNLYIGQGMVDQAIFCLEEVLLIQPNAWNIHAKLAEIIYATADFSSNPAETARVVAESMRRYLRSIELCENYLRGYYGLKLTTSKLLPLMPQAARSHAKDESYSELALPTEGTLEALHELATAKLAEIVRRGSANESGWDGYDAAELQAARELLDGSGSDAPR